MASQGVVKIGENPFLLQLTETKQQRRERIATAVLGHIVQMEQDPKYSLCAQWAVASADALIAELDKP